MDSTSPPLNVRERSTGDDIFVAVKSALTLGTSLLLTWSVALVVRIFLPRYLGPSLFGTFNFADSFCTTFFVFLGLGVDTYIQKEIPIRPEHASDFFGGFILLRLGMSALLFAAMAVVLALTHRAPMVQRVVFIFGLAQMLVALNGNLAALLHAARSVSELAVVNVGSKILWSLGIGASLLLHAGLDGLAAAFLFSEVVRAAALLHLTRRYLGIRMEWRPLAVKAVIIASFPFYLSQVANSVYAKIGISLLSILSNDTEVGWYSSAFNLAGLSLLVSPLVASVLLPLLSRAASRSEARMLAIMSRSIRVILMIVLPVSLLLGLGAELWVRVLFGPSFAPATLSLRVLAPMFVLTYVAMVVGTCLVLLGRAWSVTVISFGALALNLVLNLVLVPRAARALGPGGAGAAAATSVILAELAVMVALLVLVGARAFDRWSVSSIARAVGCCALVIGIDALLRPLGSARLLVDAAAYPALLFSLGAVRAEDTRYLAQRLLRRHRPHAIT
jgi:O-antigen/teichoic acid export membrane protein